MKLKPTMDAEAALQYMARNPGDPVVNEDGKKFRVFLCPTRYGTQLALMHFADGKWIEPAILSGQTFKEA